MDNIVALNRLEQEISCLEPITRAVNRVNIFEILGISHTEIRHSNMLAWLMDPGQNHGLGDRVLREIVESVTPDRPRDYSKFVILRELNHIDLIAVSQAEKWVICIENKTYSGEHDDQLNRYREYIESTYPG